MAMNPALQTADPDSEACDYIIGLIYERCRVNLRRGKEELIKARLGKRMRELGFATLTDYCGYLRHGADEDEFIAVVDSLTTNFTNFLREEEHFRFMVREGLPAVLSKDRRRFQIWSAACSTGEEVYSIAMYLEEHFPVLQGWDWRITGSDVSTRVLAVARRAVYGEDRVKPVPPDWLPRHFQRGLGEWEGHYRVKPELAARVNWRRINLVEDYEHGQPFEMIFCRNVMIYFDRATQEQFINRVCRCLVPGGYLLVGHSESLGGLDAPVHCVRPSIYRRV
jgi:chemotaxis protein methyltransferase CheR